MKKDNARGAKKYLFFSFSSQKSLKEKAYAREKELIEMYSSILVLKDFLKEKPIKTKPK
jgi:hypothetical protein